MRSRWFHHPLLHSAASREDKRVSWLEFFYDLVFAAALIELGDGLSTHVTLPGVTVFAAMFVPLWVVWTGFTFYSNRFTVDDFVHRLLVLLQMFVVGGMVISAPMVFRGELLGFTLTTGSALLLLAGMYLRAAIQVREARRFAVYWTITFAAAGGVFLVSALLGETIAVPVCASATLGVLVGPLSPASRALNERLPVDFRHLAERYGLLTMIVLGESFVNLLTMLAKNGMGLSLYLEGGVVLLLTSGLWWVYFDDVAPARIRSGSGQWIVWLYAHLPLQIAITAVGVALFRAIHVSWTEPMVASTRWLLAGSMGVAYLAVAALDSATQRDEAELGERPRINARAASGVFLCVLAPAGAAMSAGVFFVLVASVNLGQVLFDMLLAPQAAGRHGFQGARTTADAAREVVQRQGSLSQGPQLFAQVVRKGAPGALRQDVYFYLIEGSWWRLSALSSMAFVVLNAFFAMLYLLEPGSITSDRADSFTTAFYFSVQTMSTIGYGALAPATAWGNAVVTLEAVVGVVGVAVVTGLVFAKLSRPQAGVVFSAPLVLTRMHGKRVLMLRAGNVRGNEVVDAAMSLTVMIDELTPEGHHFRRMRELQLKRRHSPMFRLSWTVMHEVNEDSPLWQMDWQQPEPRFVTLIATFSGHDGTYGQTTYARHAYSWSDLQIDHHFVDIIHQLPDGRWLIDYDRFHDTEPDSLLQASAED